jgi:hypothetical protein
MEIIAKHAETNNAKLSSEDKMPPVAGVAAHPQLVLHPDHLADLRRSGLSDETIAQAGIHSLRPGDIPRLLGRNPTGIESVFEIPYPGHGSSRFKLFYAAGQKGPKYVQKKEVPNHLYIPPLVDQTTLDGDTRLFITEGEKKALKAAQEGILCLAIGGLWSWKHDGRLLSDFDSFTFNGREVFIVPDNDWQKPDRHGYRKNLNQAVRQFGLALIQKGAKVFVVHLPQSEEKVGLDDFLCLHSPEDFLSLPTEQIRRLSLDEAIESVTFEDLQEVLNRIAKVNGAAERDSKLTALSKKLKVSKRALQTDMAATRSKLHTEADTEVTILHPSYDVTKELLSLGFRETVVVQNSPQDRNIFLLSRGDAITLTDETVTTVDDRRIVFDLRDRLLVQLADRWDRQDLLAFVDKPTRPQGLYMRLKELISTYLDLQHAVQACLIAAWVIATYFHRIFHAFPFLFFHGKKQCGKSRALTVVELLSFHAFKTKGVTVASLADSLDGVRGTLAIDQAELLSTNQYLELLGILADSYTPSGGKRRIVNMTPKGRRLLEFETYGPKAFASTDDLDEDLRDRCILIPMLRAKRECPYPQPFDAVWSETRSLLFRLLLTRWEDVRGIYEDCGEGMQNRVRELWKPIEAVLELEAVSPGEVAEVRAAFLEAMQETQAGLSDEEDALIAGLLRLLDGQETAELSMAVIVQAMNGGDFNTEKAKQTWIGKALTRLSLYDKKLPKKNNRRQYLFSHTQVSDIKARYQPSGGNGDVELCEEFQHIDAVSHQAGLPHEVAVIQGVTQGNATSNHAAPLDVQGGNQVAVNNLLTTLRKVHVATCVAYSSQDNSHTIEPSEEWEVTRI